ncbi:hypothetical protein ACWC9R_29780 [Streptomyces sp. NPDC001219]
MRHTITTDQLKRLLVQPNACPMMPEDANTTIRRRALHTFDQKLKRPLAANDRLTV